MITSTKIGQFIKLETTLCSIMLDDFRFQLYINTSSLFLPKWNTYICIIIFLGCQKNVSDLKKSLTSCSETNVETEVQINYKYIN